MVREKQVPLVRIDATHTGVDENVDILGLGATFTNSIVLAETQTLEGGETAIVVIDSQSNSDVGVFLEEEQSANPDLDHENETVGIVAFEQGLIPCFTRGTRIATASGDRLIEDLVAGDLVLTMDRSYQPIRWIGSSKRPAKGDLAPILIRKGALGNHRDLRVSPQHRMLLQGWQAEMLFGEQEVLATAKSLVNDHSILRDEGGEVKYFHMLFDTHEIIYAEGAPSESFHPGEQGWKALDQATRDEILTLFPELADGRFEDYGASARTSLKHSEGQLLGAYLAES